MAISSFGGAGGGGGIDFGRTGFGGSGGGAAIGGVTPGADARSRTFQTTGQENRLTQYQFDPMRDFLANSILAQFEGGQGQIPPEVLSAISNIVTDPGAIGNIAGEQFQQIAAPLRAQFQPVFQQEQQALSDTLRKAGASQSGAAALETRRLLENQGGREMQALASSYVPLLGQLSQRQLGGVQAGVQVPQQFSSLANLLNAFGKPTAEYVQGTSLPSVQATNPYYNPIAELGTRFV